MPQSAVDIKIENENDFPKKRKKKKKINEEQGKSSKWQTNFFVHTLGEKKSCKYSQTAK